MNGLNDITLFAATCPKCGHQNPEKQIRFRHMKDINVTIREAAKRNAMKCDACGYDIYEHNKNELE